MTLNDVQGNASFKRWLLMMDENSFYYFAWNCGLVVLVFFFFLDGSCQSTEKLARTWNRVVVRVMTEIQCWNGSSFQLSTLQLLPIPSACFAGVSKRICAFSSTQQFSVWPFNADCCQCQFTASPEELKVFVPICEVKVIKRVLTLLGHNEVKSLKFGIDFLWFKDMCTCCCPVSKWSVENRIGESTV